VALGYTEDVVLEECAGGSWTEKQIVRRATRDRTVAGIRRMTYPTWHAGEGLRCPRQKE
jgi:hypothetical protein